MKPLDKYDVTLIYQLDVYPLDSRPVPLFSNFKFTRFQRFIVNVNPFQKKRFMIPSNNYSAYFQAKLQVNPPKTVKPVKEKSPVVIRYKRNWSQEQQPS